MDSIFKYNPNATYKPNRGLNLQILDGKDLYKQTIIVSENGSFPAVFPNIFTNYELNQNKQRMKIWNEQPFRLWQTQLNFATWCASSACGVSSEHLKEGRSMIRSVYRFHVYYHIRRIIKRLQTPLPFEDSFNQYDNPYSNEEFLKICGEYDVDSNPMKYRGQYFFSSYQKRRKNYPTPGLSYFTDDSMTRWIVEKSNGFTKTGLVNISSSVRAYAYLVLSSQASARSSILGNDSSALTAQRVFMNNLEDIVNRRVDIQEDIKRYQDTLNYASSKVDYSVGQGIYMIPSDMNLRIKTGVVGYNNKILISGEDLTIGINRKVNVIEKTAEEVVTSKKIPDKHITVPIPNKHITDQHITVPYHKDTPDETPTHEDEKIALVMAMTTGYFIWYLFR